MNYRRGMIDKALKLLEVDGAVVRDGRAFIRTPNLWHADVARSDQVSQNRRAELEEIRRYVDHHGCLMEFLARALDDPAPAPWGKCMNCSHRTHRQTAPAELIHRAIDFLRGDDVILDPRRQWPSTALDVIQKVMPRAPGFTKQGLLSTRIPETLRPEQGRALSIYGDAGWGRAVADGKYQARYFNDDLVRAAAELIRDRWKPQPHPEWITCVPSNRQPTLVSD